MTISLPNNSDGHTISEFAARHRVKVRRDECFDLIIFGRYGHIYEWGQGRLGVMYMAADTTAHKWLGRRRAMVNAGFQVTQDAETDGCALFDPQPQARLAMQVAGIKPIRRCSKAQLTALAKGVRFVKAEEKRASCAAD
jgi:hypothetical protein